MIGVATSFEPSPFDGLLSSNSIFVSPLDANMAAPDRYGRQHEEQQYNSSSRTKGIDDHEGEDIGDPRGDPQWRWAGPPAHVGESEAQHDRQQAHPAAVPTHIVRAASPERLDVGYGSDNFDDDDDDDVDRSWVRNCPVDDSVSSDGDAVVQQHGAPSPVAAEAAPAAPFPPPSASRSFEDQPIRGLAGAKEMSLDELIAQGERQMQEAQAKNALAKPSRTSAASSAAATAAAVSTGGGYSSRPNTPPDPVVIAARPELTRPENGEDNAASSETYTIGGGSSGGSRQPKLRETMLGGPPTVAAGESHGGGANNSGSMRSSVASNLAWDSRGGSGGGGGGGGGLRVSLRSGASFATSWSGGDPEQLRHLSMGVNPADEQEQDECLEERERREFYELEMELLQEEQEEERGQGGGLDQQGDSAAGREHEQQQHHADFWNGERESSAFEDGGTPREGRGLESAGTSNAGHSGWIHQAAAAARSDSVRLAAADRYQAFSGDARAEGSRSSSSSTRGPHPSARGGGVQVTADAATGNVVHSDAEETCTWGEDEEKEVAGAARDADPSRGYSGGEKGKDAHRWEAAGASCVENDDWPSRERDRWGQTAIRQRADDTRDPPRYRQQEQQQQQQQQSVRDETLTARARQTANRGDYDDASTSPVRRLPQHTRNLTHTPPPPPRPPPPPPGAPTADPTAELSIRSGGSRSTAERGDDKQYHADGFDDDHAWGEVDSTVAGVAERGTAPGDPQRRVGTVGRRRGFPDEGVGGGGGDFGAPLSRQAPSREESVALTPSPEAVDHGAPSQSKLVQRVFGARGRRGGAARGKGGRGGRHQAAGRGGGRAGREGSVVEGEGGEQGTGGGGGSSWAMQAEVQGKLRELEEEVARYKEENERARLARRKQESALAEVMRKRQEVREWAEAERAAVEAWCTEQRQASAREKRAALKQIQGLRARAQAGGGLGGGTAVERRQRQEIEGLKATIERAKLDAEAAKKKSRASERRLQQQIKGGAERIAELEGQVSFLERQRVDVWASATGGGSGTLGGTGGRPSKASVVTPAVSRSMNDGVRKSSNGAAKARAGGARSRVATVTLSAEAEPARGAGSRRPAERGHDQEARKQEATTARRQDGSGAAWERGGDADVREEETRGFGEGGVIVARERRQDGGVHYSEPSVRNGARSGIYQYQEEDDRGEQHRWSRQAGGGNGGSSTRWEEGEEEEEEGGGRHVDGRTSRGGGHQRDGEVLVGDKAGPGADEGNGIERANGGDELGSSSAGVRRSTARVSSSDGFKYDPMRYEMAPGSDPRVYPHQGGVRSSSSGDGRRSMAALDRTSALRRSDAGGGGGMRTGFSAGDHDDHPRQFRDTPREDQDSAAAFGDARGRNGNAGGDGDSRLDPHERRELNGTRGEEGESAIAGGGGGDGSLVQGEHDPAAGATRIAGHAHEGGRGPVTEREEKARGQGSAGAPGANVQPAAAAAAATAGFAGSTGAARSLPTGSGSGSGGKMEHVLRDGRRVILFANGTQKETLPDGGCVVRFANGDLKRVEGETGVVIYTYAAARTTHTMHPSGLEVFEFPNGQVERHHKTGEKEIDFPDGTRKYILPSGREMSEFPDGVTVVEYPEGHRDVTSPNGTTHRERPDGTVEDVTSSSSASSSKPVGPSRGGVHRIYH
ncbi:unnamed protein product [Ectocarpus sp. 12 AP-2014]